MLSRCVYVTIASLLLFGVVLGGCAKRPATTQAAAPAPTGAAATTPGSGGPAMAQPTTSPSGGGAATAAPATAAPSTAGERPEPKDFRAIPELKDVFFEFDKYDIRASDAKVLDSNATWLKSNANHLVLIEGHCDERGTNEYNLALGERRAKSAMEYRV